MQKIQKKTENPENPTLEIWGLKNSENLEKIFLDFLVLDFLDFLDFPNVRDFGCRKSIFPRRLRRRGDIVEKKKPWHISWFLQNISLKYFLRIFLNISLKILRTFSSSSSNVLQMPKWKHWWDLFKHYQHFTKRQNPTTCQKLLEDAPKSWEPHRKQQPPKQFSTNI